MRRLQFLRDKWTFGAASILLLGGLATCWLCHESVLAWYYVQRLNSAGAADRAAWTDQVAALGEAAVPRLQACLSQPDCQICESAQAALMALAERWPVDDARRAALYNAIAEQYPQCSLAGQCCSLALCRVWLDTVETPPAESIQAACRLVPLAGRSPDPQVRGKAIALAGTILRHERDQETVTACRELLRRGLLDTEAENRAVAARLAGETALNLLPQVAPLLDDPAPQVRQAAMLAVGPHETAVATDDLLRSLHDTDEDVRRLCETALKGRGLRAEDVLLGRLISDQRPDMRLQVLDNLRKTTDVAPAVWLRRLSHDPSPAVRAAAVRAAGEEAQVDFADRLMQMSQNDPSPTVRQLAQYYLLRRKPQ
ncbi:MAG: HEAT repeat domain-containing protein [Planctomycetia bacterium]|nr:HEAT repeat domain-containing protein [Planctomycetia bacterium]